MALSLVMRRYEKDNITNTRYHHDYMRKRICIEDRSVVKDLIDLDRALNAADMDQDGLITIFDLLLVLNKLYSGA